VENAVSAWLSSQNVGPIYYGRFQNGRVEEFYPHHSPLSWKEMSQWGASHVAPIMARFHSLQVPNSVLTRSNSDTRGDIFERVIEWMEMAETLCSQSAKDDKAATLLLEQLKQDWQWLQEALFPPKKSRTNNLSPAQQLAVDFLNEIVVTHMDLQSLNLLRDTTATSMNENEDVIKVIDFEYAGFNPRAVDMANTFCEHCDMNSLRADYANEYPSDQVQNEFVQSYSRRLSNNCSQHVVLLDQYLDDPAFLDAARTEIGRYTLVSHLSWAIWSVVQAHMSDIDFDYIRYAQHRREGFEFMKDKCFSA